jgi:hypothetical protein
MGGRSSDVGKVGGHTNIMYNTYIKKWITFYQSSSYDAIKGHKRVIRMVHTSDPLSFITDSETDEIVCEIPKGFRSAYFSIMPGQADMTTCGKEFYLYYRYWPTQKNPEYNTARLKISFE